MSTPAPDTTDLRIGAPLHDDLLALLPLVGVWRGSGAGVRPSTGEEFAFGQLLTFAHDGRPFLVYESRTWLLTPDGDYLGPAARESGFWRPGRGDDDIEAVLANDAGQALEFSGTAGDQQWELMSTVVAQTSTADGLEAEQRLYAMRGEELLYATEVAAPGAGFAAHLNGRLVRQPAADPQPA